MPERSDTLLNTANLNTANEGQGTANAEPSLVDELADISRSFEASQPGDIVRWAVERFGGGLVVTASFEDPVLVHAVATVAPSADIVLLETQYLFAETWWYAGELTSRLKLNLRVERPAADVVPDNRWHTDTAGCCGVRKVEPLERLLAPKAAWITGIRRADGPTRAGAPIVSWDATRGVVKINPLATFRRARRLSQLQQPSTARRILRRDPRPRDGDAAERAPDARGVDGYSQSLRSALPAI